MLSSRVSSVGKLHITGLSTPSVLEIGDSEEIAPLNQSIAIQRQKSVFFQNEYRFSDFPMFFWPIVQPIITEEIRMTTINDSCAINVHNLDIFTASDSSVIHIGSSRALHSDSRILNVRHLLRERPPIL